MKIYRQIISAFLIISFVGTNLFFALIPKKAEAQWSTVDLPAAVQRVVQIAQGVYQSFTSYSLQYKEYVLDGIALMVAKQILRQLTASVVNWINSGFNGSPSFLTDPAGFFQDVGDKVIGDFIAKDGDLKFLCSPFSIELRIALALNYAARPEDSYKCTLSGVIKNTTSAVKNASINGFTAGDFSQGGWPAFLALTTQPQNNIYGAYLKADSDISLRIGDRVIQQKDELNQGKGFLSWKECKHIPQPGEANYAGPYQNVAQAPVPAGGTFSGGKYVPATGNVSQTGSFSAGAMSLADIQTSSAQTNCTTATPGSFIADQLSKVAGSSVDALNLADEFNEVIDALFAQLVSQLLSGAGGLLGASGKGASDTSAYLNQLQQQQTQAETDLINQVNTQLSAEATVYLNVALQVKQAKAASLAIAIAANAKLEEVKKCYTDKIALAKVQNPVNQTVIDYMQTQIAAVNTIITSQVTPTLTQLADSNGQVDTEIQVLQKITGGAGGAKTIAELDTATRAYNVLVQGHVLPTAKDVSDAQTELTIVQSGLTPITADAATRLGACQAYSFPGSTGTTGTTTASTTSQ